MKVVIECEMGSLMLDTHTHIHTQFSGDPIALWELLSSIGPVELMASSDHECVRETHTHTHHHSNYAHNTLAGRTCVSAASWLAPREFVCACARGEGSISVITPGSVQITPSLAALQLSPREHSLPPHTNTCSSIASSREASSYHWLTNDESAYYAEDKSPETGLQLR